jgi:F0F1-type ATP synthase membrane subunit c/vacuolar-type H+-ATPase subunit K
MDLLSIKSAGKAVSTSALGMLQIFGFFMGGLSFESLHKVLHFFIRVFPQTIFIYALVFAIARLPQRKSQMPFEARNVPAWQRSL